MLLILILNFVICSEGIAYLRYCSFSCLFCLSMFGSFIDRLLTFIICGPFHEVFSVHLSLSDMYFTHFEPLSLLSQLPIFQLPALWTLFSVIHLLISILIFFSRYLQFSQANPHMLLLYLKTFARVYRHQTLLLKFLLFWKLIKQRRTYSFICPSYFLKAWKAFCL